MSDIDETAFFTGAQIKKMIHEMCVIYPNIILEKVSYDMYVPEHWNLSTNHENKIKNLIQDEHILLNEFYDNKNIIKLLNLIKENTVDLMSIVENIPFYSKIIGNVKDTIFNNEIFIKIHKYFFLCTLILYIDVFDDFKSKSIFNDLEEMKINKQSSVEETIMSGIEFDLKKIIANLLKSYLLIFIKRKKIMNLTNLKIETNILKAKEQEKDGIRQNLKNLTEEQRTIENIMKNEKLGKWSFGQSKAVFEYDADQFDKEINEIENRIIMEKKSGIITDTTQANIEIFQMGQEELDYLEKQEVSDRISRETNFIDFREDGDADEENDW